MESPKSSFVSNTGLTLSSITFSTVLYAAITWFVQTTAIAMAKSDQNESLNDLYRLDSSTGLAILRLLQATLTYVSSSALGSSLELIQWGLSERPEGMGYVLYLALSPATGIISTSRILVSRHIRRLDRFWALTKLTLNFALWLAALLLFLKTSDVTAYDTSLTYKVTAGVGPFNGSLIDPFFKQLKSLAPDYPYQTLPYSAFAIMYNLVINPTQSSPSTPVHCTPGALCTSYFLSGGIAMTTPWLPTIDPDLHPTIRIANVQGIQLDFESTPSASHTFSPTECTTYGTPSVLIATRLCLRTSPTTRTLLAGLFVCPSGPASCIHSPSAPSLLPNLTTTLTTYLRTATLLTSPINQTILSLSSISPPTLLHPPDLSTYIPALSYLLNFTATNLPPPSSPPQNFWSSSSLLLDPNPLSQISISQNFHSLLAFPLWFFNPNNYGNPTLDSKTMISTLDHPFYTTAAVGKGYNKFLVDEGMLIGFWITQGLVIAWVWGVVGWVWWTGRRGFEGVARQKGASGFVLFDAAVRVMTEGRNGGEIELDRGEKVGDGRVLEIASGARVRVRRLGGGRRTRGGEEVMMGDIWESNKR